ncbi:restriction endonuclease [Cytobacillus sp. FSL M8-0252]|uniref:restriction endonuclease n=1 Tax=Cytobacillus sp. FSL M8-0252 TaxID=2921621 RepID=UPI0030F4EF5E
MYRKKRKKSYKKRMDLFYSIFILSGLAIYYFTGSIVIFIILIMSVFSVIKMYSYFKTKNKESTLKKSGILDIDVMDGVQFEYYLSALFKSHGYKVKVTSASRDYGADLILKKGNDTIVVQAKRYKSNVGIKAIQEITASKSHYKASNAWVVSNSFFTKPAIELADSNNVKLIDRKKLMDLMLKVNPTLVPSAQEVRENITPKQIHCPKCDSKMVIRKGKNGNFYGCSKFPQCKGTKAC